MKLWLVLPFLLLLFGCVTSGSRSVLGTWSEHALSAEPGGHVVSLPVSKSTQILRPVYAPYKPPAFPQAGGEPPVLPEPPKPEGYVAELPLRTTAANYRKDHNEISMFRLRAGGAREHSPRSTKAAALKDYVEVAVENTLDEFLVQRTLVVGSLSNPIELHLDTTIPKHVYSAGKTEAVVSADNQQFLDITERLNLDLRGGRGGAVFDTGRILAAASQIPMVGSERVLEAVPVQLR